MPHQFGHEKLKVYQKGLDFVEWRVAILKELPRRTSACDHLERAAESIVVNIAHASNLWSPKDKILYLGYANGSALECAACMDVFVAKGLLSVGNITPAKLLLVEIVNILITMQKTKASEIREDEALYNADQEKRFSHERLSVYQASLQLSAWVECILAHFTGSADVLTKLDKFTTAIPLNIAEGTGRFSGIDQAKFYRIAYKATVQSSALLDLSVIGTTVDPSRIEEGRNLLRRIAAMLISLTKAATNEK